ncbi:hypothetical protein RND81_10G041000 [Saponaria officinalis]|uniref:Protein FAR1-RELATED SEQUENCE n=1 Tax=Saponaria officinalis TaxID=3572 RepID=A0AAW1I0M7_SAPOF
MEKHKNIQSKIDDFQSFNIDDQSNYGLCTLNKEQEVIEDIPSINIIVPNQTHLCNLNEAQNYEKGSNEIIDEEILRKVDSDVDIDIEEHVDVDDEVSLHEGDKIDSGFDVEGCKAGVKVKHDDKGYFVVVDHLLEHNHDLTPTQWQHHHRLERAIPAGEGDMIKVMTEVRMPPSIQYRYLAASCGGEKFVGHTKKDHYNFMSKVKSKIIENGDAQTIIDLLSKRVEEDPSFFLESSLMVKIEFATCFGGTE